MKYKIDTVNSAFFADLNDCTKKKHEPFYAISDLHIGNLNAADDYYSDDAFYWLHEKAKQENRKIYIVGDVIDNWENTYQYPAHSETVDIITNSPFVVVMNGNHDNYVWDKTSATDGDILLQHGHQADIWNCELSFVGRFLTKINYLYQLVTSGKTLKSLEKALYNSVLNKSNSSKLKNVSLASFMYWESTYIEYAANILKKTGRKGMIFGHTHDMKIYRRQDFVELGFENTYFPLINCGTWTNNQNNIVIMEPKYGGSIVKIGNVIRT